MVQNESSGAVTDDERAVEARPSTAVAFRPGVIDVATALAWVALDPTPTARPAEAASAEPAARLTTLRTRPPAVPTVARTTGAVRPPPMPSRASGSHLTVPDDTRRPGRGTEPTNQLPTVSDLAPASANAPTTPPPTRPPTMRSAVADAGPVSPAVAAGAPPSNDTARREANEIADLMSDLVASETRPPAAADDGLRRTADQWWTEIFEPSWLRLRPEHQGLRTRREADFVDASLGAPRGGALLDLACGAGRHVLELGRRGYKVTGVDLSRGLLEHALRLATDAGVQAKFMQGDMRALAFDGQFDGAYCLDTSFGYFDDRTNLEVLAGLARAVRPGGRVLLQVVNRDHIVGNMPRRVWWESDGQIVMEEINFDARLSRLVLVRTLADAPNATPQQRTHRVPWEQTIGIRLYGVHEWHAMMNVAGLRVLEVSGSMAHRGTYLGEVNRQLWVLAERPA